MLIPTYFNIFPDTQTGEVYGTEFTFSANLPAEYVMYAWDFGDNSEIVYNKSSTSHTYKYPGVWTVQLSSWTNAGNFYVDNATINVDYVHRDSVLFTQVPETYGIPGLSSVKSFIISVTSAKIDQPLSIVLQSFNSKSVPLYSIPEKWSFITPTWRFVDTKGAVLQGPIQLDTQPIYNSSNKIVAVKADKEFYYIDDLATGLDPEKDCPLMLIATLSTERFSYPLESIIYPYASYSNNEVTRAVISWQINDIIPTNLKVTENYLNDIYPIKWTNIPIPVLITLESDSNLQNNITSSTQQGYKTIALSYPRTNDLGNANEVVVSLSSSQLQLSAGVHYKVPESPLHFKATDDYGNIASGYIFTTIVPLTSLPTDVVITASTTVVSQTTGVGFTFPIGYPIQPNVYISHPAKSSINRLNLFKSSNICEGLNKYRALGVLVEGSLTFVPNPTGSETFSVSSSNVYALTFNPAVNRLYTADIELNTLHCYEQGLYLIKSVNLENYVGGSTNVGPSYISIDGKNNVWVSLFDNKAVLKFDSNLNYLLSAVPTVDYHIIVEPPAKPEEYLLNEDGTFLDIPSVFDESVEIHPPIVETDRENNIWVCYPGDSTSTLFKFNSNGIVLLQAQQLPTTSYPVSLSIDIDNHVWVACKNTHNLLRFTPDGVLDTTVSGLIFPSYIAHERTGNICILHGYDIFSIYNVTSGQLSSWRVDMEGGPERKGTLTPITTADYTEFDYSIFYKQEKDEIWGGLCTDVYNRIWIIDSDKNKVMSFDASNVQAFTITQVTPTGNYKKYFTINDSIYAPLSSVDVDTMRSAQAGGDWSGNRWYQKYAVGKGSTPVTGISKPFKIIDLDKSYTVSKINNNFDYTNYFKRLAMPEILQQNYSLFNFLSASAGDGNPSKESIGRVVYEKIANFVLNNNDVETAEVKALESLAQQMNVEHNEYGNKFPVAVADLINLCSISKHHLRGNVNYETDLTKNIGNFVTEFDMVTANRYYLARDKTTNKDVLVWVDTFANQTVYPAPNFISPSLRTPLLDNYTLFEYNIDNISEDAPYIGNVIDWQSPYTTLSYSMSSDEDWYKDGGLVETMFNNLLTKQLFL